MTESDGMKTAIAWKILGVMALVPGVLAITFVDLRARGWRVRTLKGILLGAWHDWHFAFFADPEKPFLRKRW